MQVDLMWHISSSITMGSWVRKAGTGELVWKSVGGQGRTSCPGQLKSLQPPPLWTYSTSPTLTRRPRPSLSSDGYKTSTRAWHAQAALGGASERRGNMDQRWRIEGTRPLFSVFISLDCAALDYWVWVATLFTCIWKDVMAVWRTPSLLTPGSGAERLTASWNRCWGSFMCSSDLSRWPNLSRQAGSPVITRPMGF